MPPLIMTYFGRGYEKEIFICVSTNTPCGCGFFEFFLTDLRPDVTQGLRKAADGYIEFKPVLFNDRGASKADMYLIEKKIPENFYKQLAFVMKHYQVTFKEVDGVIYVKTEVWSDQDYMANLTAKANDDVWLGKRGYKE